MTGGRHDLSKFAGPIFFRLVYAAQGETYTAGVFSVHTPKGHMPQISLNIKINQQVTVHLHQVLDIIMDL